MATLTFFFGSHDFNTEKLLLTNRSLKFVRTVDFAYFLFHLSRAAGTYEDVGTGLPPIFSRLVNPILKGVGEVEGLMMPNA